MTTTKSYLTKKLIKLKQPYRCRRRRYLSASLYDLPFAQRSPVDSYNGQAWQVPFSDNYSAALQTGREYAAHFAQYLKDMPAGQPDNELGLIIRSMCLDEKSCAKGFQTGFFYYLERLMLAGAQTLDVFDDVEHINTLEKSELLMSLHQQVFLMP